MPEFAVSLRDGSGNVSLSALDNTLTINDYSNYIASTEEGHLKADFEDFKKIIVTDPEGSQYTYSTLVGGDESILTPDNYSTTPIQTSYTYTDDGLYAVTLRSVPTWENVGSSAWEDIKATSSVGSTAIQFITSNIGYASLYQAGFGAGENGMCKTINGGTSWTISAFATTDIYDLFFIDANTGWVCCENGATYYTTNGGTTWTISGTGGAFNLYAIHFINDGGTNKGITVSLSGEFYVSTNGGVNWTLRNIGTAENLTGVQIISPTVAHVIGENGTFITVTNWQSVTPTLSPAIAFTSEHLYSLSFIDSTIGYVAGANGVIFKTTDSATTWTSVTSGVSTDINSIDFYNSLVGGYCGTSGEVRLTEDGGTTWTAQTLDSPASNTLNDIFFLDASNIFVSGGVDALTGNVIQKYSTNYNNYDEDDCVYYSGTLYQANTDTYNSTPGVSADWDVILETALPEKYNVTEYISIREQSFGYYAKALIQGCCSEFNINCNDEELCEDKKFINAIKIDLALACSQVHMDNSETDKANILIDEIKFLSNNCCE